MAFQLVQKESLLARYRGPSSSVLERPSVIVGSLCLRTIRTVRTPGKVCNNLADRVLVGAGVTGNVLDMKDASLPDHAHEHKHVGNAPLSFS